MNSELLIEKNGVVTSLTLNRPDKANALSAALVDALEASADAGRKPRMHRVNPKYVLRNYLAETAIRNAADQRDYSEIDCLMRLLAHPYDEQPAMQAYAEPAPQWASALAVSCSS